MKRIVLAIMALLASSWAGAAESGTAHDLLRVEFELADRITHTLLDPILGPGKAAAFVHAKLEVRSSRKGSGRTGRGVALNTRERQGAGADSRTAAVKTSAQEAGRPDPQKEKHTFREQRAEQTTDEGEIRETFELDFSSLRVVIIHDKDLPAESLAQARSALSAAFPGALAPESIELKPVVYAGSGAAPR